MNSISSSKNGTLLLVIALAMALLFAIYYYVVKPKQDDAQAIHSEVNNLKAEILSLEQTLVEAQSQQSSTNVNEFTLRKKVPDNRAIDSLILSIEEIEFVTGSRIQSVEFNNYDILVSDSGYLDPTASAETEMEEGTEPTAPATEDGVESTELPVSTIAVETLPPSLKLVTFNVNVASPNDVRLQQFIKEIEKLERVMHIDTIDFSLPGEEAAFSEGATDVVTASIQITTFYYED